MVTSVFAHFDGVILNLDHGGRKFGPSPVRTSRGRVSELAAGGADAVAEVILF